MKLAKWEKDARPRPENNRNYFAKNRLLETEAPRLRRLPRQPFEPKELRLERA
jgi:hypothetical protein